MRTSYPTYKSTAIPWLPKMPEHWDALKAKHIFKERSEKGYPDEPLLAATQTKGVVRKEEYETRTVTAQKDFHLLKLVKEEDFVISLRSFQGGIEYAYHRGIISPAYTIFYERNKVPVNKGFYRHLFKSHPFINSLTLFVTGIREGQNIDYAEFKDSLLPLPPLPEQTAIANYLDAKTEQINRFIEKKEKLIALLKEQKQAVINELLEDKEGKWERRKLKYIVSMKSGSFIDAIDIHETGDFPVYGGNGLRGFAKSYTHEGEYVLIGRQGALCGNVNFAYRKFWPSEHAIVCTPKIKFDTFWFGNAVRSLNLGQYSQSAAQPGISIGVVSNVSLPFPDYTIQQQISESIKREGGRIDETIKRIEKEIEKVKELKQSLIAEVVTGRIKVV